MVRAFSHPDPAIATLVRHAMDDAGLQTVARGGAYGAAGGEVPPVAAWAEVWIADPSRLAEADAIARAAMVEPPPTAPWTCAACGETCEGQFAVCWQCGAARPEA